MGATYTRQSSYTDGDIIQAADTNNEFDQLLAAFAANSGHTHDGTTGEGGPITKLLGNSLTFGTGADTDVAVTFDGNTSDGILTWKEDEDYFEFSDDILIASTEKLQFRDTAIYINSSTDGQLDLIADGAVLIDTAGDITLDADGGDVFFKDGGTTYGSLTNTSGNLIIKSGTTTAMTFDGANVTFAGTVTIGSAGISEAELEILDGATVTTDELNILDGVTATTAELNIMDGVTSTTAELNIVDGDTSASAITVADADRVVLNDGGTMKQVAVTSLAAYFDDEITAMPNLVTTAATTVGALDSGSITSGFGNIDVGSSNLTATGTISLGATSFNDNNITNVGSVQLDSIAGDADTNTSITFSGSDVITMATGGTTALTIDASQNVTVAGDLTVSGDDITLGTNTSGHIMVADGTNFNPVAVSGDVTIASNGAVTIASGAVETAMLNENVISGQSAETSLDTSNDTLLLHDASASGLKKITLATLSSGLGGITDVVADTSPQLGGNLDMNGQDIVTTSNADIELAANGTGKVVVKGNTNQGAIKLNCEANSHGQIIIAAPHSESASNTLTLPSTGGDARLVSTSSTATLTNKTLTSPKINEDVAVTATATEINLLDGVTSTTSELNILDGVTSTASELNLVDGSSAGTIANSKAVIYGSSGEVNATTLQIAGTSITSTAAELNILDGVTATATELNIMDGDTSATSTTLADADRVVTNDNGTMKQVALTDVKTYLSSAGFSTEDPTALAIALG